MLEFVGFFFLIPLVPPHPYEKYKEVGHGKDPVSSTEASPMECNEAET